MKAATITRRMRALLDIHALMDGREWDADTLANIADILERAGLPVKDLDAGQSNSQGETK